MARLGKAATAGGGGTATPMPTPGSSEDVEWDNPVSDAFEIEDGARGSPGGDTSGQSSPSESSRRTARQKREAKKQAKIDEALAGAVEFRMVGKSLGVFPPESGLRSLCFTITTSAAFDSFIMLLILFAPCVLVLQMPAYVDSLSADAANFIHIADLICLVIFTVEALLKVVALGFARGEAAYLGNAWNRLDFFLVCMTWLSIILQQETPLFKLFRALRALRPLRKLRLMAGLAAILEFYPYILNVCAFLIFFFCMFGTIGIQMFGGVTSYRCVGAAAVNASTATGAVLPDCPPAVPCPSGKCEITTNSLSDYPDERINEVALVGFDNILQSFLTQFVITTLDEWPAISHPMLDIKGETAFFVWPFFLVMVLVLSIITANLFVSVICYAFGNAEGAESAATVAARVKKIRSLFERIDADSSGEIEPHEIVTAADAVGVNLSTEEIQTATFELDYDGSGLIDFEEFAEWWRSESSVAARIRKAMVHEEALISASFEKIDVDGSGTLDSTEVNEMAFQMGISLTPTELTSCMWEMDKDGSAEVDIEEFTAWWFSSSSTAAKVSRAAKGEQGKMKALFDKLDKNNSGTSRLFLLRPLNI